MSCKQVMSFVAAAVFVSSGVAQAGLVAYWNLDDTAANTTVPDSVGSSNGTLLTANGGTLPSKGQQGVVGNAYRFFGTNTTGSGIMVSAAPLSGLAQGTFSAWYNLDGTTGPWQPRFFQTNTNESFMGFGNLNTEANRAYAYLGGSTSNYAMDYNAAPSASTANTWHLMTTVFNGTNATLYVDGVVRKTATLANYGTFKVYTHMSISGAPASASTISNNNSFPGLMDDIGVVNEALSATQVKALYNAPLFVPLGAASNGHYGLNDMLTLFSLFTAGSGTAAIGSLTWQNTTGLTGHNAGDVWDNGSGTFFMQLDASGNGLTTSAIPEPASITMFVLGLTAIIASRRRNRC